MKLEKGKYLNFALPQEKQQKLANKLRSGRLAFLHEKFRWNNVPFTMLKPLYLWLYYL